MSRPSEAHACVPAHRIIDADAQRGGRLREWGGDMCGRRELTAASLLLRAFTLILGKFTAN